MKIPVLGDIHWGSRVDSEKIYINQELFYRNVFFPYIKEHNIKTVFQTGDLFDNRLRINTRTLNFAKRIFFDPLKKLGCELFSIAGNHDAFYKDSLKIVTGKQVLTEYDNVTIYSEPHTQSFDGVPITFIPWICKDNEQQILEYIKDDTSPVCMGHFELAHYQYSKSSVATHGMDSKLLENYKTVISGHYHTKSAKGNILYVGTPTENTWEDYDDGKGFWVFDTDDLTYEFIPNHYNLFETLVIESVDDLKKSDKHDFDNKFLKVFVNCELKDKQLASFEEYINTSFKVFELTIVQRKDEKQKFDTVDVAGIASNRELISRYSNENVVNSDVTNKLLFLYDIAKNNMRDNQ